MNHKGKKLIQDILIFALGNIGSKLILFFLVPLYTNYMSRTEYGTADLVFTVAQILIPLLSVTVFDAVVRFGLIRSNRPEDVLLCAFAVLGVGTAAAVLITPLFRYYAAVAPWRWYLCAYTILSMGVSVSLNYLKVRDRNLLYSIASLAQTLVLAVMNIVLIVSCRMGIAGYLLSNVISCAFAFLLIFLVGRIGHDLRSACFRRELLREMVVYSAPLILNNIAWWIIHSSDKIMVELMIGAAALGVYTVATKIPSLINVFISIFSQAWGLSSIREIEQTEDTSFYSEVFSIYTLLAFLAASGLIAITKPFMQVYTGADFRQAWQYVPFLLVSAVFSAVSAFYGSMYAALKKSRNNMWTTLAAALVNIILNYIFILEVGVWGAVIGTVAAYVAVALARAADVQRMLPLHISWARFAVSGSLLFVQAFAVSFGFLPYVTSALCFAALAAVNAGTLRMMAAKTGLRPQSGHDR